MSTWHMTCIRFIKQHNITNKVNRMKVIAMTGTTIGYCYYRLEQLASGMFRTACYKEGVFYWATSERSQKWRAIEEYKAIHVQLKYV